MVSDDIKLYIISTLLPEVDSVLSVERKVSGNVKWGKLGRPRTAQILQQPENILEI
jgi:hypothetical protein